MYVKHSYICAFTKSLPITIHCPYDSEILGWYSAGSVLLHLGKVHLQPWLANLLVIVSQEKYLLRLSFATSFTLAPPSFCY